MTQDQPQSASDLVQWRDLIPRLQLTADEDPAEFESIRNALIADLDPGTPYETMLAENLVALEWESFRHRRLREGLLLSALRQEVVGKLGQVGRNGISLPEQDRVSAEFTALLDAVSKDEGGRRSKFEKDLKSANTTLTELVALAYSRAGDALAAHETRLAQLELRRRRLLQDFKALKQVRLTRGEQQAVTDV